MSAPTPQRVHERDHRHPERDMGDCWDCRKGWETCRRKRRLHSAEEASQAALEMNIQSNWERRLVAYRCPYCTEWHLTTAKTKDRRKRAEKQRRRWLIEQHRENA